MRTIRSLCLIATVVSLTGCAGLQRSMEMERAPNARVGMKNWEVVASKLGQPHLVNTTTTANGVHEQWVYRGGPYVRGTYVYLTNGVVTAIQN